MSIFTDILPTNNPNEGKDIINSNFNLVNLGIFTGLTLGYTQVSAGTGIDVYSANTLPVIYSVSQTPYSNSDTTPSTIGGIPAGSTFSNVTISQMFTNLLYPYQYPAFSSFSIAGQSQTLEAGATLAGGSRTFNWGTTNSGNINANTIIIEDITTSTILANHIANAGTSACTISSVTNNSPTSHTWEIFGTNSQSGSFNDTFTVNWQWRLYYGTSASTPLTNPQITGLTSSVLTTAFAGTYPFAGNAQYDSFAYPSSFGTATSFKDTSTNLGVAMQPLYVVSVMNAFGQSTNYNVHQTQFTQASALNIAIS